MHLLGLIALCSMIIFIDEVKADCGGLIDILIEDIGVITSPSYPNSYPPNLDCTWEIKTYSTYRIGVYFTSFDLEEHSSCGYDSLTLKSKMEDGTEHTHGSFCGKKYSTPKIVSKSNILLIKFKTDGGTQKKGFSLKFLSVSNKCGGSILWNEGLIISPHFPFYYPPHTNCTWNIQAPNTQNIKLDFSNFQTENSTNCNRDYVTIQSKMSYGEIREHGKFCGFEAPPTIFSESNNLLVHFVSDDLTEKQGFKAKVLFEGCGGVIEGSKGNISTPFFPNPYPPNKMCEWTIQVPPQHKLKLRFLHFETEEGGEDCSNDFLLIQSKTKDGEIQEYGKYCGTSKPPLIFSRDTLLLTFVSDLRFQSKGFQAEYFMDMLSDYELTTSLMKPVTTYPSKLTTMSQYEREEIENVTSTNEINIFSETLKMLAEKVSNIEDSQITLLDNYENILRITDLMKSKISFLREGGKNISSSVERQLFNDCEKFIFFLRRMLDSEP